MAVREGEYLLAQQGEKTFMLIRNGDKYHLVAVDRRFTQEREEKLMQLYPCSDETLRELGINFTVLSLRGVAAGGCNAGDGLILYVGKKKYRYVLADDYTREQMNSLFAEVEKFQMPKAKQKGNSSGWRLAQQKPELLPVMKLVKYALLVLSIGSSAGMLLHHAFWSVLGIGVMVSCCILDLVFPQYFTLLDMSKGQKQKHAIGLAFPAALPLMVQALYVFNRFNYQTLEIHLWSVGAALVVCAVFGFYSREFSERTGDLLALLLLLGLFAAGPIGMVNSLTDFAEPDVYPVIVEEMHISSGKNENYYCTVTLKTGEKFDLSVTRVDYERIREGQRIVIALHEGGLGIAYISLVES